jgi:hypothetical protein
MPEVPQPTSLVEPLSTSVPAIVALPVEVKLTVIFLQLADTCAQASANPITIRIDKRELIRQYFTRVILIIIRGQK